jgi:hypothetical protein
MDLFYQFLRKDVEANGRGLFEHATPPRFVGYSEESNEGPQLGWSIYYIDSKSLTIDCNIRCTMTQPANSVV